MKVLITGSKGMLGSDLMAVLSQNFQVIGIDIDEASITDKDKIIKIILQMIPDLIIHTAAYTDVDGCEKKPDLAFLVNGEGTKNISLSAVKLKIPLVYISTDYVFDGEKKNPYIESDTPSPLNIYGKSKLRGEEHVKDLVPNYFIIRTAGLFGKNGKNFVKTILQKAKGGNPIYVVADQIHSPTYTLELSKEISRLITTKNYGIYHITNNGECSWYKFAKKILDLAKIKDIKLIPISLKELNRPAKRPRYSVLSNQHLIEAIGDRMSPYQKALKEYLNNSK